MSDALPLVFVGLLCVLLMPAVWLISTLNRFARLRNLIRESWSNVDVALKRRHDLIPNLVETCKAYAKFESETLERVVQARNEALAATGDLREMGVREGTLSAALTGLFGRVEAYPELKASAHFRELQDELANTEDRIAAARRFYNSNVRDYKIACESFPSSLLAPKSDSPEFLEFEGVGEPPSVPA